MTQLISIGIVLMRKVRIPRSEPWTWSDVLTLVSVVAIGAFIYYKWQRREK